MFATIGLGLVFVMLYLFVLALLIEDVRNGHLTKRQAQGIFSFISLLMAGSVVAVLVVL